MVVDAYRGQHLTKRLDGTWGLTIRLQNRLRVAVSMAANCLVFGGFVVGVALESADVSSSELNIDAIDSLKLPKSEGCKAGSIVEVGFACAARARSSSKRLENETTDGTWL
jgi:hypothetical protein